MLTLTVPALTLLQQTTKNPDIPSPLPFDVTTRGQFSCVTVPKSGDLIAKALVVREKTSLNERTLKPNNTETLPDGSLRECFSWFQRSATYIIQMTYSDGHDAIYWADSFRGAPSGLVSARKPEQRDWRKGH